MGSNEHTDLPKNGGCIGDFYWGYGISIGAEKHVRIVRIQWLVGGFNPSEKYDSVGMMTFPIYGKVKFMFQTTNQIWTITINNHYKPALLNTINHSSSPLTGSRLSPVDPQWLEAYPDQRRGQRLDKHQPEKHFVAIYGFLLDSVALYWSLYGIYWDSSAFYLMNHDKTCGFKHWDLTMKNRGDPSEMGHQTWELNRFYGHGIIYWYPFGKILGIPCS